jgi:hypothetical protein
MKSVIARVALALALAFGLLSCGPSGSDKNHRQDNSATVSDSGQTHYDNEQEAQDHCPGDVVVWVNSRSEIYHMPGERWYGNTEEGYYECQQDADAEGDRETRNGQ